MDERVAERLEFCECGFPGDVEGWGLGGLFGVLSGLGGEVGEVEEEDEAPWGEVLGEGAGGGVSGGFEVSAKQAEFPGGGEEYGVRGFAGDLGLGVEVADGIEIVAEELQAHGPGAGEGVDIDDATAEGDLTFLSDLGLGFVGLVFEPFDEVHGIALVAFLQLAGLAGE